MKKRTTTFILLIASMIVGLLMLNGQSVHAQSLNLQPNTIRINQIEVRDVLSGKPIENNLISIISEENYVMDYSETEHAFYVRVHSGEFASVVRDAQNDILQELDVTKNEACYLGIYAMGPSFVHEQEDDRLFYPLPFCEGPESVDINEDAVVNGVDLAACFDDYSVDIESDSACDFNLDKKINAVDISNVIQFIGQEVDL